MDSRTVLASPSSSQDAQGEEEAVFLMYEDPRMKIQPSRPVSATMGPTPAFFSPSSSTSAIPDASSDGGKVRSSAAGLPGSFNGHAAGSSVTNGNIGTQAGLFSNGNGNSTTHQHFDHANADTDDGDIEMDAIGEIDVQMVPPPTAAQKAAAAASAKRKGKGKEVGPVRAEPEELCGFCFKDGSSNSKGQPEAMVSCFECGRSGHPSCLGMFGMLAANVRKYNWHCQDCKKCEVCSEEGDISQLLFCDSCDRGYHMSCLDPPMASPPHHDEDWTCGTCANPSPMKEHNTSGSQYTITPKVPTPLKTKNDKRPRHPTKSPTKQDTPRLTPVSGEPKKRGRPLGSVDTKKRARKRNSAAAIAEAAARQAVGFTPEPKLQLTFKPFNHSTPATKVPEKRSHKKKSGPPPPKSSGSGIFLKLSLGGKKTIVSEPSDDEDTVEEDPALNLPFGGVLTGEDADTSKGKIQQDDKQRFEAARKIVEARLIPVKPTNFGEAISAPPSPASSTASFPASSAVLNRPLRERLLISQTDGDGFNIGVPAIGSSGVKSNGSLSPVSALYHNQPTPLEKINKIQFGQFDIDTWYMAPYPEEYSHIPNGRLHICEYCLRYIKTKFQMDRHKTKCKAVHPPGDEVYRDGAVSVFEIDGRKNRIYCQNLCLISKMFLDHKTLYYDVEPFLFYVMTECDDKGARFVGYFSKEKRSPANYNVSCIMTLPVRQRKGWGNLLIDFSYLLSKKENRVGSPEKPLSDLGSLSYKNYWTLAIFTELLKTTPDSLIRVEDLSLATSMTPQDVLFVLKEHNMIVMDPEPPANFALPKSPTSSRNRGRPRKYGPGSTPGSKTPVSGSPKAAEEQLSPTTTTQNISRDVVNQQQDDATAAAMWIPPIYKIDWKHEVVQAHMDKYNSKGYLKLMPNKLKFSPFLVDRSVRGKAVDRPKTLKELLNIANERLPVVLPEMKTIEEMEAKLAEYAAIQAAAIAAAAPPPPPQPSSTIPQKRPRQTQSAADPTKFISLRSSQPPPSLFPLLTSSVSLEAATNGNAETGGSAGDDPLRHIFDDEDQALMAEVDQAFALDEEEEAEMEQYVDNYEEDIEFDNDDEENDYEGRERRQKPVVIPSRTSSRISEKQTLSPVRFSRASSRLSHQPTAPPTLSPAEIKRNKESLAYDDSDHDAPTSLTGNQDYEEGSRDAYGEDEEMDMS